MSSPIQTTQYMQILLPEVGVDNAYPEDLITAFTTIDDHNHLDIGKGLSESSINWTSFDLSDQNLVNALSLGFSSLSANGPELSLYYKFSTGTPNLFYTDGNGTSIQLTKGGNIASSESINGFYGDFNKYSASVVYTEDTNNYTFTIGDSLASINVNSLDMTTSITGGFLSASLSGTFDVASTGFFPPGCIFCIENSYVKAQSANIALATGPNPRLIQNTDQLNNITPDFIRYTRFALPFFDFGNTVPPTVRLTDSYIPLGTCTIVPIQGDYFPHSGITYDSIGDYQTPGPQTANQYQTPNQNAVGAITGITPVFEGTVGTVEVYATFKGGAPFFSTILLAASKNFNITFLVTNDSVSPSLNSFQEFHLFDPDYDTVTNTYYYRALYTFEMFDANTGLPTLDYYCIVRI